MKKLLLFQMFCLVYVISNAQVIPKKIEGKPSYEETVEFIKTNIALPLFNNGLDGGYSPVKGIYRERMYKIKELKFTDCVMELRYVIEERTIGLGMGNQQPKIETFSAVIDFSKVESISWWSMGEQYCVIGIQFHIKGLNKGTELYLPITRIECPQGKKWDELREFQIFKAFENLRKMCGAPEPIKF